MIALRIAVGRPCQAAITCCKSASTEDDNDNQDRQNAAPVQLRTLCIGRKSKRHSLLHQNPPGFPDPPEETTREKSQAACFIVVTADDSRSKGRVGGRCLDATRGPRIPAIERCRTSVTRPVVVDVGRPFYRSRSPLAVVVGSSQLMELSRFVLDSGNGDCGILDRPVPSQIDFSFEIIGNLDTTPIKMASMSNPRCHVTRPPRGESAIARVTANNPVRR